MVDSDLVSWLASDSGYRIHAGILILLMLGGIGFPIPEDIPLLLGGVAASKGIVHLQGVFLTCYVGVMIGDQTMYFFGHFFGHRLLNASTRSPFFPAITAERVHEVREGLRKHRLMYIFIGRHLFPIRSLTFVTAGALRVPFIEFLLADAVAALISVGLMVGIGYLLGSRISPEMIEHVARELHWYIAGAIILSVAGWYLIRTYKRRRRVLSATEQTSSVVRPGEEHSPRTE